MQLGCVNTTDGRTGCVPGQLDAGIRTAAFHFAPGERVSALSLFAGPDNRGAANARAGAIRFSTSLVRRSLSCSCQPFVLPNVLFVSGKSAKAQTSQGVRCFVERVPVPCCASLTNLRKNCLEEESNHRHKDFQYFCFLLMDFFRSNPEMTRHGNPDTAGICMGFHKHAAPERAG